MIYKFSDVNQQDKYELTNVFSHICHDIKNYISTMYACYQLTELREPQVKELPMWNNFKTIIHELNAYMDSTAQLRYTYRSSNSACDVSKILFSMPDICDDLFPNECRNFDFDIPKELPAITADENNLVSALTAIFKNAYEATHNNDTIFVKVTQASDSIRITITDLGPGVDEQLGSDIFAPFTTTKRDHIGIGLTIASNFAASCGGEIEVDTCPNHGTSVHLTLPII